MEDTIVAARALGEAGYYRPGTVLNILLSYYMAMEALADITAQPNREAIDYAKTLVESAGWKRTALEGDA